MSVPLFPSEREHVEVEVENGGVKAGGVEDTHAGTVAQNAGDEAIQEATDETRAVEPMKAPRLPTAAGRAEHDLTHANFRSRCCWCVIGKGVSRSQFAQAKPLEDDHIVPTVHSDYGFMGDKVNNIEQDHE